METRSRSRSKAASRAKYEPYPTASIQKSASPSTSQTPSGNSPQEVAQPSGPNVIGTSPSSERMNWDGLWDEFLRDLGLDGPPSGDEAAQAEAAASPVTINPAALHSISQESKAEGKQPEASGTGKKPNTLPPIMDSGDRFTRLMAVSPTPENVDLATKARNELLRNPPKQRPPLRKLPPISSILMPPPPPPQPLSPDTTWVVRVMPLSDHPNPYPMPSALDVEFITTFSYWERNRYLRLAMGLWPKAKDCPQPIVDDIKRDLPRLIILTQTMCDDYNYRARRNFNFETFKENVAMPVLWYLTLKERPLTRGEHRVVPMWLFYSAIPGISKAVPGY